MHKTKRDRSEVDEELFYRYFVSLINRQSIYDGEEDVDTAGEPNINDDDLAMATLDCKGPDDGELLYVIIPLQNFFTDFLPPCKWPPGEHKRWKE